MVLPIASTFRHQLDLSGKFECRIVYGRYTSRILYELPNPFTLPDSRVQLAMTAQATKNTEQETEFFRCPVVNGRSDATIRVGRAKAKATVQDTSIDGFTIIVPPKYSPKLKVGKTWILEHEGARTEVHPLWFFNTPEGNIQLGLRRLRDVTPPENDRNSLLIRFGGARFHDPNFSAAAYGGIVLALICLLALPGWGDHMGTSDRIEEAFKWVMDGLDGTFGRYL